MEQTEILNLNTDKHSTDNIGEKAINLNILKAKFNVPKLITISETKISNYLDQIGLSSAKVKKAFLGSHKDREFIRTQILKNPFNYKIDKLNELNQNIIIRSAAIGEDNKEYSFAGIFESKTTTKSLKEFHNNLNYVIQSAFSERVYHYTKQIGLSNFPKLSLILQNYVNPEYAGISFSTTIYNRKKGLLINAVKGSAEKAVLGQNVTEIFITGKNIPKSKFPSSIISKVHNASKQIERIFGKPQDIEWCYANKTLWILQSRPITKHIHEEITVWDNSNIAESYSGIVLPLTCSFAQFVYARVYRDVAKTSNIDIKKIKENSDVFDNLLGFHYGRFYYNMNNWYKMLTLFPGYDRNKENLDMMISARSKAELDDSYKKYVSSKDKFNYYIHIIRRILFFNKDLTIFKKNVKLYLKNAKTRNLVTLSLNQLWAEFEDYQKNLLNKWSITVDNDFLAMTWFGSYKKVAKKKGLSESELIQQMTNLKSVISAEQVSNLQLLSKKSFNNKERILLAKKNKWVECYEHMLQDETIAMEIKQYIETYGGRFANELKLETEDLDSDPAYLAELLYTYFIIGQKKQMKSSLIFEKSNSIILNYLSNRSKQYLKNREEMRLLRSQAFSYTRKLFIAIGKKLVKEKRINQSNEIFYLKLNEIKKAIRQRNDIDLNKIIKARKKEYKTYTSIELDEVLLTRGNEKPIQKKNKNIKIDKIIKGIGCSTGQVSGDITVMNRFTLPKSPLDIVVVKHTDPGWTPLFGLCKGLIVEYGGVLSHAAIISRELNLPCIIGVNNATKIFKNGNKITMNASTGVIEVIKK